MKRHGMLQNLQSYLQDCLFDFPGVWPLLAARGQGACFVVTLRSVDRTPGQTPWCAIRRSDTMSLHL